MLHRPTQQYAALERSPTLKRIDDQPVWAIVCFFVTNTYRRRDLTGILIQGAIDYSRDHGAKIIEAYPLRTELARDLPYERYMGIDFDI